MGAKSSRVRWTGPLAQYGGGFRDELIRVGYKPKPVVDQLRLMAHASRWLAEQDLSTSDFTSERVAEFLAARRARGYTLWLSPKAMVPMLDYLQGLGALPLATSRVSPTPAEQLLDDYRTTWSSSGGWLVGRWRATSTSRGCSLTGTLATVTSISIA